MRSRQKRVPRENWVVVRETHEPVIDRQTWEKTQRLLGKRTREPGDFRENVLAGFLRCGGLRRAYGGGPDETKRRKQRGTAITAARIKEREEDFVLPTEFPRM